MSIVPSLAGTCGAGLAPLPSLGAEELERYSRHLLVPELGIEGQRKLKASSVLCLGAGGLGSPAALYLAAAGVGRLGIADFDVVDVSNLHRQVLHATCDIGRSKIASARARLEALNPGVRVETHELMVTARNALDLFAAYDVIVDGSDNLATRYLVNDACVLLGKPYPYGSVVRFDGQASVFAAADGPCYRCLFPEPPPPEAVPSCAEAGVLGVLPGVIGTIQATEAIKLLLGIGEPLVGRLLVYDALRMRFRELRVRKDPDCPVCGTHPTVRALIDYERACGPVRTAPRGPAADGAAASTETMEITPTDLKARLDRGDDLVLLDVREPHETLICNIEPSTLIPLGQVPHRLDELPRDRDLVVYCRSGARSFNAVVYLRRQGFTRAVNLKGGMLRWIDEVDPSQPKY